jgi:hypothetical protein
MRLDNATILTLICLKHKLLIILTQFLTKLTVNTSKARLNK